MTDNYPRFPYANFTVPAQVIGLTTAAGQLVVGAATGLTTVAPSDGILKSDSGSLSYTLTPTLTSVALPNGTLTSSSDGLTYGGVVVPDKTYVDAVINGLAVKEMCKTALFGTTSGINDTISVYNTYNGSSATGIYNGSTTITFSTQSLYYNATGNTPYTEFTINDRVLISFNNSGGVTGSALNGIYRFNPINSSSCSFIRTDDANSPDEYYKGLYTYIDVGYNGGTSISGNSYILTNDPADFTALSVFALFTMSGGLTASTPSKLLYYNNSSTLQPSIVGVDGNQLNVGSNANSTVKVYGTSNSSATLSNSALSFGVSNEDGSVSGSVLNASSLTTTNLSKLTGTGSIAIGSAGTGSVAFGTSANASGDGSVVLAVQIENANANTMVSPASIISYAGNTPNSGSTNFTNYSGLQSCLSGQIVVLSSSATSGNVLITTTNGTRFISSNLTTVVTSVSAAVGTTTVTLRGSNDDNTWYVLGTFVVSNSTAAEYATFTAMTTVGTYRYLKVTYDGANINTGSIGLRSFIAGTLIDITAPTKKEEQPLSVKAPVSVVEPEPVAEVSEVAEVSAPKPGVLGWLFGSKAEPVEVPEQVINKPSRPMSQRQINALKKLSELDVKTIMN